MFFPAQKSGSEDALLATDICVAKLEVEIIATCATRVYESLWRRPSLAQNTTIALIFKAFFAPAFQQDKRLF